jgi:hypothetical protein
MILLTILSILLIGFTLPIYGTTDDKILAGFVDGSYTGDNELRSVYIQPIINILILPFYYIVPNIGWYSISQLFFLVLALSLLSEEVNAVKPILNNLFLALSTLILLWFVPQPTFTAASFLICLLGIMLLVLIANNDESNKLKFLFVAILLIYSVALRPEAFLGALGILSIPVLIHHKKIINLILKNLRITFFITLVPLSINYIILSLTDSKIWQAYDNWNSYRHQLQNRVSQNSILENIDKIGWSIPEHNLFVDLSYGDPNTFNSDWIKPAFDLTRDKTGITGLINANFSLTSNKVLNIIAEQQAYFLSIFILSLVLFFIFTTYRFIVTLIFSFLIVLFFLYFISSTLHTPERIVIPLIFCLVVIQIIFIIYQKKEILVDTRKLNLLIITSIAAAIVLQNGFFDSYTARKDKIEYSENVKKVLDPFSKKFILIGSVGTEINHLTSPYYQSQSQIVLNSIIAGNWETFSPHWFKRNEKLGVLSKSVYQELISNSNSLWLTKKIPDTSYSIELYLRERQVTEFNRKGISSSLEKLNLYHFGQNGVKIEIQLDK